ncbi:MAG: bifunctional [glutamate--ammonia ligase]-adenylyl-L-tyrosine phosphorylase/[glutamate--ammonia-ligase] adenylyltransferase [Pseudomonadota bacterium]
MLTLCLTRDWYSKLIYYQNKSSSIPVEILEQQERKWNSFRQALKESDIPVPTSSLMISDLKTAFLFSDFILNSLTRNTHIFEEFMGSNDLYRTYPPGTYVESLSPLLHDIVEEKQIAEQTSHFRCREMIRIAFRDLTGHADLSETMSDLSALADACIDQVFSKLYDALIKQYGIPQNSSGQHQNIVVLGLGKLGARELNFSSDVDLMFAFPDIGMTNRTFSPITNHEFFSLLAQSFLKVFAGSISSGIIFRVDLRLRPFGENGPLVMSFNSIEKYYEAQGREWERYALIKARAVAGDRKAGDHLLKRLNPFIYRRYLDYNTFDALREMKQSIHDEIKRRGFIGNIKLGPGGIREIEFFGQVFQLIRGGVEPLLQEPSILRVLQILSQEKHIRPSVCDELTDAYRLLRNTEHRLQEFDDRQTHSLPKDAKKCLLLALSLGFPGADEFHRQLDIQMKQVHYHFNQILSASENIQPATNQTQKLENIWKNQLELKEGEDILFSAGFKNPAEIRKQIELLQNDTATRSLSREGRRRLDQLMPRIIEITGKSDHPELSFSRITELIKTIEQRTNYLSLLIENPSALKRLVSLSIASPWIIQFLTRHPVLLDELLDTRILYRPPDRQQLADELEKRLIHIPLNDLEMQIEQLCIFKQINILRVAAADISANYPLMRVSDHLSDIAELILSRIFQLSFDHLSEKYGYPSCSTDIENGKQGFAVIAYGKLGGIELGYGSDLDMVFLHAADSGKTTGGKGTSIDNSQFYARLGQRIIHTLTSHTRAGRLYEIDMRLRPSGSSGPLVSHIKTFREYLADKAWTWEHQALVRARSICGDPALCRLFEIIRKETLMKKRDKSELRVEIWEMREKIRKANGPFEPKKFHLKQGRGGIIDIEFIVQYLVLANASQHPEIVTWSDNVRQLEALAQTGIMEQETSLFLKQAYLAFRANVHHLNLQDQPPVSDQTEIQAIGSKVEKIWKTYFASAAG